MQILFWIIIVTILVVFLIVLFVYNTIIKNKNSVIRSWADVITYERQKNKILPEIESVVKEYQEYERDLQINITQLRTSIDNIKPNELNNKILKEVEDQTTALIKGIRVALENYPDLKASNLMQKLMTEIVKQQENISAAITIFNKNIEEFNNGIQTFPNHIINNLLNNEGKLEPFLDQATTDLFDYKLHL